MKSLKLNLACLDKFCTWLSYIELEIILPKKDVFISISQINQMTGTST